VIKLYPIRIHKVLDVLGLGGLIRIPLNIAGSNIMTIVLLMSARSVPMVVFDRANRCTALCLALEFMNIYYFSIMFYQG